MVNLPNQVLEEFDIFKNGIVVKIYDNIKEIKNLFSTNKLDRSKRYIFYVPEEILTKSSEYDALYEIIEKFNLNAYISQSTVTNYYKSTHPLTNFIMWRNHQTRRGISWNDDNNFRILLKENFPSNQNISNLKKNLRGILSVRKKNEVREILFSKNPKIKDGITRYSKWPSYGNRDKEDVFILNKVPTMDELVNEYKNSYFSFVCETISTGETRVSNVTEKTIIAFLTGTMPIIMGAKGIVDDLEKAGFKLWNNDFGFGAGDVYSSISYQKVNSYLECINNVNNMTMSDVEKYWNKNLQYIQHNYNLINHLLFSESIFDKYEIFTVQSLDNN